MKLVPLPSLALLALTVLLPSIHAQRQAQKQSQKPGASFAPAIPKSWDDAELAELEVPLATAEYSPAHAPADYYYRVPVQPVYRSHPIYAPGKEPPGYPDKLKQTGPVILWDDKGTRPQLQTEADWIAAGEIVFTERGTRYNFTSLAELQNPAWWRHVNPPLRKDGLIAGLLYVIREKGKIEIGSRACAECHTRVLPDGTTIKGAQGNFPGGRETGWRDRNVAPRGFTEIFGVPWIQSETMMRLANMKGEETALLQDAIPPGVFPRHGASLLMPVVVPDLIGVKDRKYLDRTGLQLHRGAVELMRCGALNQGMDFLSRYGEFICRSAQTRCWQ